MDSTERVQFDESNDPVVRPSFEQAQKKWKAPKKGMIDWLIAKGIAKNETDASNILLIVTIVIVLLAITISVFLSKPQQASLEQRRTTQWNNQGHPGKAPPYFMPNLK